MNVPGDTARAKLSVVQRRVQLAQPITPTAQQRRDRAKAEVLASSVLQLIQDRGDTVRAGGLVARASGRVELGVRLKETVEDRDGALPASAGEVGGACGLDGGLRRGEGRIGALLGRVGAEGAEVRVELGHDRARVALSCQYYSFRRTERCLLACLLRRPSGWKRNLHQQQWGSTAAKRDTGPSRR